MFEVWESREEPMLWLVFREGPSFPGSFAVESWSELGGCQVVEALAAIVTRQGYVLLRSKTAYAPDAMIGPDAEPV